jgi:hypothetical protein
MPASSTTSSHAQSRMSDVGRDWILAGLGRSHGHIIHVISYNVFGGSSLG